MTSADRRFSIAQWLAHFQHKSLENLGARRRLLALTGAAMADKGGITPGRLKDVRAQFLELLPRARWGVVGVNVSAHRMAFFLF